MRSNPEHNRKGHFRGVRGFYPRSMEVPSRAFSPAVCPHCHHYCSANPRQSGLDGDMLEGLPCLFFFKKKLFVSLSIGITGTERETQRGIFHLLAHSLRGCNGQD